MDGKALQTIDAPPVASQLSLLDGDMM